MMRNGLRRRLRVHARRRTWSQQAYIKTWNAEGGDSWGVSVALSDDGNTLAMGSIDEDCSAPACTATGAGDSETDTSAGAAAVFTRTGTTWTQQAYVKSSNSGPEDWFGGPLVLSGDGNTLALGAQRGQRGAGHQRQAERESADRRRRGVLPHAQRRHVVAAGLRKGSNNQAFDEFGGSVGLSRDGRTMVVGARGEDSTCEAPTATRPTTRWTKPAPHTCSHAR